jgi:hypothetical protein
MTTKVTQGTVMDPSRTIDRRDLAKLGAATSIGLARSYASPEVVSVDLRNVLQPSGGPPPAGDRQDNGRRVRRRARGNPEHAPGSSK